MVSCLLEAVTPHRYLTKNARWTLSPLAFLIILHRLGLVLLCYTTKQVSTLSKVQYGLSHIEEAVYSLPFTLGFSIPIIWQYKPGA